MREAALGRHVRDGVTSHTIGRADLSAFQMTQETRILVDRKMLIGAGHGVADGAGYLNAAQRPVKVCAVIERNASRNRYRCFFQSGLSMTATTQTTGIAHNCHWKITLGTGCDFHHF